MKRFLVSLVCIALASNAGAFAQKTTPKKKGKTKAAKIVPTDTSKMTAADRQEAMRTPDPEMAVLDSLQKSDKRYESIEEALKEPEAVRFLDLHEKNLTTLPSEIGKLVNLHTLSLYGNQLTTIPAEFGNLKNLKSVDFGKNQLTEVPASVLKLKNLKVLYLTSNQITKFPKELCTAFPKLNVLDVGGNQIASLPADISKMQEVRIMNFRFNRLETLPESMAKLKKLEMIQLNNNPISEKELRKIDKMLKSVDIRFTY